jgi:hypothetical protein
MGSTLLRVLVCMHAGFKVCIIDPAPLAAWPNNYGAHNDMHSVELLQYQASCVFMHSPLPLPVPDMTSAPVLAQASGWTSSRPWGWATAWTTSGSARRSS